MIEIAQLAQDAIAAIAPLLPVVTTLAGKTQEGFAGEAGKTLFNWIVSQVKGKPAESVLDRALADPRNPRRLESLRLDIEELAEQDPAFREHLAELVQAVRAEQPTIFNTQTATVTGQGHSVTQIQGSNNKNGGR
jgi:hypothetical protein